MAWTCDECGRSFGRRNQSHGCAPAFSIDEYFAGRPPVQRKICDAVAKHLRRCGEVQVEAVTVGILFKRTRTFAELRGKRDRITLSLLLDGSRAHPKITKVLKLSANRSAHTIDLFAVADVDKTVRGWLSDAYLSSPP